MVRIVKLSDFHVPFHAEPAINVALKLLKFVKPDIIVLDEVIDFYSLSKFDKDPRRKLSLQDNLNETYKVVKKIRQALPNAQIIQLESNHDKRLKKFLNSKAEELSQLTCLKIEELFKLKELKVEYRKDYMYKGFLFKHGSVVRKDSAYTAKAELLKEGVSGASGHTHRLGSHYKTLRGGSYVWVEGGCMCDPELSKEYIDGTADWQQGFVMVNFIGKRFYVELIPIIDNEIFWGGKLYK